MKHTPAAPETATCPACGLLEFVGLVVERDDGTAVYHCWRCEDTFETEAGGEVAGSTSQPRSTIAGLVAASILIVIVLAVMIALIPTTTTGAR